MGQWLIVNSQYYCLSHSRLTKLISFIISFCLILEQSVFAQTIDLSHYFARNSASNIPQSDKFRPLHLRYISYDNQANDFKLLLDKGDFFNQKTEKPKNEKTLELEKNTQELMKYFFIGLALPNEKFWVNLRPDSPDNILDPDLEKTDIGRIFLEADLQLKKDTAGMTSPQTKEGREYWDKLYKKAGELFGSENITIPTITRPWIVPNEIIIRESPEGAYIYKATLKVMLEEDYLISRGGSRTAPRYQQSAFSDPRLKELNQYSTQLIKESIITKLTYELNASKRYASLRQVYYSLILAQWFKQKYGGSGSSRATGISAPVNRYIELIDSGNLINLASSQPYDKQSYFQQYQKSFKDGEYSLQDPVYTPMGQSIRRYVSGGGKFNNLMASSSLVPSSKDKYDLNRDYIFPAVYGKKSGKTGILTKSSASPVGWSDQLLFDIYEKQRKEVRPAIKLIVEETMKEYLGNALKILEIGSGRGELAGMLPTEMRGRIVQSDRVLESLRQNNSKLPKIAADAYNLPFRNVEMPGIVSFAVLDTFFDIDRALQEFYRVLKPGGTMIGFIDLLPSHEVMMNYWSDEILFPSFVNIPGSKMIGCRGNLRVSKVELLQKLNDNKAKLSGIFIKYMNVYISNPIEQYIYIQQHSDSSHICRMLKSILDRLDINYTETDQLFLFKDILEKAVVRNGFGIAQSNIKTVTLEIDEELAGEIPLAKNVVYFHTGAKWFDYDATIPDGKVKIVASVYVLAANKKEDAKINGVGDDVSVARSRVENDKVDSSVEKSLKALFAYSKFAERESGFWGMLGGLKKGDKIIEIGGPIRSIHWGVIAAAMGAWYRNYESEGGRHLWHKDSMEIYGHLLEKFPGKYEQIDGEFSSGENSKSNKVNTEGYVPAHSQDVIIVLTGALSDPFPVSNAHEVFREMLRVIKPGGRFVIGTYGTWDEFERKKAEKVMNDVLGEERFKGKIKLNEIESLGKRDYDGIYSFDVYKVVLTTSSALNEDKKDPGGVDSAVSSAVQNDDMRFESARVEDFKGGIIQGIKVAVDDNILHIMSELEKLGIHIGFAGGIARKMVTGIKPSLSAADIDIVILGYDNNKVKSVNEIFARAEEMNRVKFRDIPLHILNIDKILDSEELFLYESNPYAKLNNLRDFSLNRLIVSKDDNGWIVTSTTEGNYAQDIAYKRLNLIPVLSRDGVSRSLRLDSVFRCVRLMLEFPDFSVDGGSIEEISKAVNEMDAESIKTIKGIIFKFLNNPRRSLHNIPENFLDMFARAKNPDAIIPLLKEIGGDRQTLYSILKRGKALPIEKIAEIVKETKPRNYNELLNYKDNMGVAAVANSPLLNENKNAHGGVDFAALPIQTQAMPVVSSALTSNFKPLTSAQMETEWAQIQAMVNAAIRPSAERLERYAVSVSSSLDYPQARDKFTSLLADILRNDETSQRQPRLEPALKNILLALESE